MRSDVSRTLLIVSLYTALAAAGIAWSSLRGWDNVWRFPGHQHVQVLPGMAIGVLQGLTFYLLCRAYRRTSLGRGLFREVRDSLGGPSALAPIWVIASAVAQSIFFTGALMPAVGAFPAAAIFGLLMVGPKVAHIPFTFSSFLFGLASAALFTWSGDLTGVIIAEATYNALNLRDLGVMVSSPAPKAEAADQGHAPFALLVAFPFVAAAAFMARDYPAALGAVVAIGLVPFGIAQLRARKPGKRL
jgi:hypothetical protein